MFFLLFALPWAVLFPPAPTPFSAFPRSKVGVFPEVNITWDSPFPPVGSTRKGKFSLAAELGVAIPGWSWRRKVTMLLYNTQGTIRSIFFQMNKKISGWPLFPEGGQLILILAGAQKKKVPSQ